MTELSTPEVASKTSKTPEGRNDATFRVQGLRGFFLLLFYFTFVFS